MHAESRTTDIKGYSKLHLSTLYYSFKSLNDSYLITQYRSSVTWHLYIVFILFVELKQSEPQALGTRERRLPGTRRPSNQFIKLLLLRVRLSRERNRLPKVCLTLLEFLKLKRKEILYTGKS